jgi:ArsR family transcriptional regulator, arsenate/arsenite/antimonite-responsive transcriptional repressor
MTVLQIASIEITLGFKALSDPIRLQVVELLREQEMCVCDLRDRIEISSSKLSFHLKTLKTANLVRSRQQGKWLYYSLNMPQFVEIEQYLADFRRFNSVLPARACLPEN